MRAPQFLTRDIAPKKSNVRETVGHSNAQRLILHGKNGRNDGEARKESPAEEKKAILLFVTRSGRVKGQSVYVTENRMVMVFY